MTQEQKLEIVYKKLFNEKAFTKEGTQFFEEPLSTFSQVPLSNIYINSDYVPSVAPKGSVAVAGKETLTYVEKEPSIPIDAEGKRFKSRNGRIVPISYGTGYGIEIRTQDGEIIDEEFFPYTIDWESGEITFDAVPFDVDFNNPPLLTYHFYSGETLDTITSFKRPGQRGAIGPTGPTGPIDDSVLVYRGQTDFTVSPAVQYQPNDVVTFTTNGNSYICLVATTLSPIASPSSWENISPFGSSGQMAQNVFYVNHPNSIPTAGLTGGSSFYFTSLQDAIDHAEDGIPTTIVVNQLNNWLPIADGDLTIENKNLNIVFRKWGNVSSDLLPIQGFTLSIKDSTVVVENAQIGDVYMFKKYDGANEVLIDADAQETNVRFIECRINSKLVRASRSTTNNATVVFERCSINSNKIVLNCDLLIKDSMFSGCITGDYSTPSVQGKKHIFHVINSVGFQRATRGSARDIRSYDVTILSDRQDLQNLSVKFENSILPGVGFVFLPEVQVYSPDVAMLDSNNCVFYHMGLDRQSSFQSGTVNVVGSNNNFAVNLNNFDSQFSFIDEPYNQMPAVFHFSIDGPGGAQIPVVTWDQGSKQFIRYDVYNTMVLDEMENLMLAL